MNYQSHQIRKEASEVEAQVQAWLTSVEPLPGVNGLMLAMARGLISKGFAVLTWALPS